MPHLTTSIEIDAPREHVFALAADVSKQPEWTTFIKGVAITSGDGRSPGTTDETLIKVGPQSHDLEGTWTEFKPGEVFARSFTGYMDMTDKMTFAPAGKGTRVEWTVDYKPPFGVIGKIMAVVLMARMFQNELEASLDRLKATLES